MKKKNSIYYLVVILLFLSMQTRAQDTTDSRKGKHQVFLMISNSHIMQSVDADGNEQWIVVPSWGFDYNYWIASHWAAGLHMSMMLENFVVKDKGDGGNAINRTRPIAVVAACVFKPKKHSSFIAGIGEEFAPEEDLVMVRAGYEYGFEITDDWGLNASATYDFKLNTYDTWAIGLSVSHFFGGGK
jgi:hypothetical protein